MVPPGSTEGDTYEVQWNLFLGAANVVLSAKWWGVEEYFPRARATRTVIDILPKKHRRT